MDRRTPETDSYIAFIHEISERSASFVGPLPTLPDGQLIEVHIKGYPAKKARVVDYFAGGYRLDFVERVVGGSSPLSSLDGNLTLARTIVPAGMPNDKQDEPLQQPVRRDNRSG